MIETEPKRNDTQQAPKPKILTEAETSIVKALVNSDGGDEIPMTPEESNFLLTLIGQKGVIINRRDGVYTAE